MRIVSHNITTLDGRLAVSPRVPAWQDTRWQPVRDRGFKIVDVGELHATNVVLEGSNSFVSREAGAAEFAPDSSTEVGGDFLPRVADAKSWMVVPDSRGRVRWIGAAQGGTYVLVLVTASTPSGYLGFLRDTGISYVTVGEDRVDLRRALERVGEVLGVDTIISTGGGLLNGTLLRQQLLDEVDLQVLPVIVGRPTAPAAFEVYDLGESGLPMWLSRSRAAPNRTAASSLATALRPVDGAAIRPSVHAWISRC